MEGMMNRTCLAGVVVACLLGTAASAQTPAAPTVYKPGNGITAPRLLKEVKPSYTPDAMRARVNGVVVMQVVVLTDGMVGDVQVTRTLDAGLDTEAIKAVKQWRFTPGLKDGSPVPVSVEIEMSFSTVKGPKVDSPSVAKQGPGVTMPQLLKEVKPTYPREAMTSGITGGVVMQCVVLTDGTVGDVFVTKSLESSIDTEAVRTVRQWTFTPGQKDGKAVPVQVEIEMTFTLK
jgi:TonB family protein